MPTWRCCSQLILLSVSTAALAHAQSTRDTTWRTYVGAGFTLRYPPGTVVLQGNAFSDNRPGTVFDLLTYGGRGASTTVTVRVYTLGPGRSPQAWIDSAWAAQHPTDPDVGPNPPLEPTTLPGGPARRGELYCGDCVAEEVFMWRDQQVLALDFVTDEVQRRRLPWNQARFARLLRSVRWVR